LKPDEIDCINSHGLSHRVFDAIETEGLKLALGKAAYQIPITSIKSMTGASFSGDGILQVISSCMILQNGVIPPTINLETPDPDCDLDYVPNKPRVARVRHVLTNTRAIGGTNAALIIGQGNS
jgi:3-oxoacyl-(acyl-carrier-protein) synthase